MSYLSINELTSQRDVDILINSHDLNIDIMLFIENNFDGTPIILL